MRLIGNDESNSTTTTSGNSTCSSSSNSTIPVSNGMVMRSESNNTNLSSNDDDETSTRGDGGRGGGQWELVVSGKQTRRHHHHNSNKSSASDEDCCSSGSCQQKQRHAAAAAAAAVAVAGTRRRNRRDKHDKQVMSGSDEVVGKYNGNDANTNDLVANGKTDLSLNKTISVNTDLNGTVMAAGESSSLSPSPPQQHQQTTSNPWMKIDSVKPISIGATLNNNNSSSYKPTSDDNDVMMTTSYSRTLSFQNASLPTNTTASSSQQCTTLDDRHTLDAADWPSLSANMHNLSLSSNSHNGDNDNCKASSSNNSSNANATKSLTASKSCSNFDGEAKHHRHQQKKQPVKWKPLILDMPKREKRPAPLNRLPRNGSHAATKSTTRSQSLDRSNNDDNKSSSTTQQQTAANNNRMVKSKSTMHRGFVDNKSKPSSSNRNNYNDNHRGYGTNSSTVYKDYLYGLNDAIIVEEVPIILSVDPRGGGVYCATTVAPVASTAATTTATAAASSSSSSSFSSSSSSSAPSIYQHVYHTPAPATVDSAELEQQIDLIRKQIEYYFSPHNLNNDMYMRGQMDAFGCIALSAIAEFNRIRMLSGGDSRLVVEAVRRTPLLEVFGNSAPLSSDDISSLLVRPRYDPMRWPLNRNEMTTATTMATTTGTQLNPDVPEFKPKTATTQSDIHLYNGFMMVAHPTQVQVPPYYYAQPTPVHPYYMPAPSLPHLVSTSMHGCQTANDFNNNRDHISNFAQVQQPQQQQIQPTTTSQ